MRERACGRSDLRSGCRFTSVIFSKCTPDGAFQTMCNLSKKRRQLLANLSKKDCEFLTTNPWKALPGAGYPRYTGGFLGDHFWWF